MTIRWEDLNARARGLATHLLSRGDLATLARAPDVAGLAEALRRHGYPVEEGETSPAALDLALRREAAARMRVLARWCGLRGAVLVVLFGDEDRRSLRAIVRGAVQGVPAEQRLTGLVPTPTLPERALRELARRDRAGAIAALLVAWRHPYGSPLLQAAAAEPPDLFKLELALSRSFALRATAAAGGRGLLARYVRDTIDLENAYGALVLASEGRDVTPKETFLAGGARVSIAAFEQAVAAGDIGLAGRRLAVAFAGTVLGPAFERYGGDPTRLESAVLGIRGRELLRITRLDPLGPAPLLAYALRLRAEMLDLRRVIWGVALTAPRDALVDELVSA
jgi:vacuolar-type H+-ATPase subunit C/Vma6